MRVFIFIPLVAILYNISPEFTLFGSLISWITGVYILGHAIYKYDFSNFSSQFFLTNWHTLRFSQIFKFTYNFGTKSYSYQNVFNDYWNIFGLSKSIFLVSFHITDPLLFQILTFKNDLLRQKENLNFWLQKQIFEIIYEFIF